jgi:hypothetical protein
VTKFYIGCVSLIDGIIEETCTYEKYKELKYHELYFSSGACERIRENESAVFIVTDLGIEGNWRVPVPGWIVTKIYEQIQIIGK